MGSWLELKIMLSFLPRFLHLEVLPLLDNIVTYGNATLFQTPQYKEMILDIVRMVREREDGLLRQWKFILPS